MPKIILIPPETRADKIKGRAFLAGMEIPDLAKKVGIPKSTMYCLLKRPDDFRVSQMGMIQKKINMTLDEFLMMHHLKRSDFPGKVSITYDSDAED